MKNLKINKNILKENPQTSREHVPSNIDKINFKIFLRNEYKTEAAKYPFLSKAQINQRVINRWKKQQESYSKLNSKKFRNKSDNASQQKSRDKENYNNRSELIPPKHRSKRNLVPLNVDFIPTIDDGILKRNFNTDGEKRRVSFNKKLYIRYRTTSEESSSSTFKEKKNIKGTRKPSVIASNNHPETYESFNLNTTLKQKQSKLDQKFDELLNKQCSWSYKSQNETQNKNMDTQAENLQPMHTTFEVQITEDKCEKALNDKSSKINMINCSNDSSAKENINKATDCTLKETNSHQMKTYSNINRIPKTKFKNINVNFSTSQSDKTKTTKISMNEIIESSSSSDEVLQTRYSVNNKHILQADECHSNDCSSIFMGSTPDKETIFDNDFNSKPSPIIIQATAYNKNKDFTDLYCNKIMSDVIQQEGTTMNKTTAGIKNRYSLSITTNYSDDVEKNSTPISNENRDEQFDIKVASDNIVKDFLNGSFNISKYQFKKPSVAEQSEKQRMVIMQANTENIQQRNTNDKRIIDEFIPMSKKYKFGNPNEKESFHNPTETSTSHINKKKSDIKKAKTAPKLSRIKKSTESVNKKIDNEKVNLKEFSKEKEKRIQQENKTKNTLYNKEQDLTLKTKNYSLNKTSRKRNSSLQKCRNDSIITESPDSSSSSLTRYPKRRSRTSSLIASKKIKEIELLENKTDSCEEIIDSNDEINYTSKLCSYSNSNDILRGKAHEIKEKQENVINIVKNKMQSENANKKNEEANAVSSYFRDDKLKNIPPITTTKTVLQNPFKVFDQSESVSRKNRFKRNFIPDLNSFDQYFSPDINSDLSENLKNSFEDKIKDYKSQNDNRYNAVNKTEPTNSKNVARFNETIRESKHRTWDSLEKDLLKELDEMPVADNICKTVILQEQEVIRKKEVVTDTDLFTVSNTSKLQTIRKSTRRNKYNMHYEIKNMESKIFESKAKIPYHFKNKVSVPCSSETVPSNSKSISILNKTLAAMKKCTENFISPQVKIFDYEQKESSLQFEDVADNSDVNQEAKFHTSVTYMAKDNKQYYSNEIIGYMKKSKRDREKISFKQSNVTTILKDLRDQSKEDKKSDYGHSDDAEHSKQPVSVSRNYLFENYSKKNLCKEKSQTLIPNSDEKLNPWSILMKKLDETENYEDTSEHLIADSEDTCKTDKNVETQIDESCIIESNLKDSFDTTDHKDKIFIPVDEDEAIKIQKGVHKQVVHKTIEPLVGKVYRSKSFSFEEGSNLCETQLSNNFGEEKNIKKNNKQEYSEQSASISRNYLFENYPMKNLCKEKSQTLVSNYDGKSWNILMKKLADTENYEDNSEHFIVDSENTCKTDKNVETPIRESCMIESNLKDSFDTADPKDKILIPVDEDMKIQKGVHKQVVHKTIEPLVGKVYRSESFNSEERSNLCETQLSNNFVEKKNTKNNDKQEKSQVCKPLKKSETELNKEPVLKQCEENTLKNSPKYNLKIDRDGSLKIKHFSESSSVSNSSQDFRESRKISASDLKSRKCSHVTNDREKYTRYIKRKLDKHSLLLTKDKTDGSTKWEDEQLQNNSKKNPNQKRNDQLLTKVNLIAENLDDIFSISSSDSETGSKM